MSLSDDIESDVTTTISTKWSTRTGRKAPSTEDIALAGGAVEPDATYLYSDLADSSKMAKDLDRRVVAKIIKSFLSSTTKIVHKNGGTVISFDGDRILAVFYGDSKNSDAAKSALKINYAVTQIIRPKFESSYDSVKNASFTIKHCTGVDTGTVLIVRAGARGANDLVSIGRGPNLAAKLSDLRETSHTSYVTAAVYNSLNDTAKYGGENNTNMWEACTWTFLGQKLNTYRSTWHWKP